MTEKESTAKRRKQVEVIKKLGRDAKGRGHCLPGLRAARLASAFTQRDLAARIGSSQRTILALEREDRGAYPKTIQRLCVALAVEPADLLSSEAE